MNDVSATLLLQDVLDHTAYRLLLLPEEVITRLNDGNNNDLKLKLQAKWGCDGSSDQSQYNQKYVNVESTANADANFFATTLMPLRMTVLNKCKTIVWKNPTPQSPRWCRPLRFHFAKETEEFTLQEIDIVQTEMAALNPFVTTMAGLKVTVLYETYLSMIDGKVLAAATKTKSTMRCCICHATSKDFNNLDNLDLFKPKEGTLSYGLSVLHLWIRSFEWLLHLSYRKNIGQWQLRGPELKAKGKERKKILQERFLKLMSLRVDFPPKKGAGNSNNGNVSRSAFAKPELLSEILELDEHLIENVRIILIALSCQLLST